MTDDRRPIFSPNADTTMASLIKCLFLLQLSLFAVHAYDVVECYWAADEELPGVAGGIPTSNTYLPCGEISEGVQSCCRVGHNCLEANACYAPEAGMVYTAGCTDSSYASSQCPTKCDTCKSPRTDSKIITLLMSVRSEASYWVGHSYCNGTSNQWACCPNQYGNPSNQELYPFNNNQPCWCPEENAMIGFTAPAVIPSVAYLDLARPGLISYYPGHAPSTIPGDSSTKISTATTGSRGDPSTTSAKSASLSTPFVSSLSAQMNTPASNAASSTAVPQPEPSTSPPLSDPGLSTGAKIGIGVGIGAGALVLAGLIGLLVIHLRKRRKTTPPPIEDQIRPKSFGSFAGLTEARSGEGANGDLRSPAWSGHKSELPADESAIVSPKIPSSTASTGMVEVEGSTARGSVQSQPSVDGNGVRQYVPYSVVRGRSVQSMESIHEMPG